MIVYVDLEHERVKQFEDKWQKHLAYTLDIKYRLEDVSGKPCLVIRYDQLNLELLANLGTDAVVISGNMTEFQFFDEADLAGLRALYQHAPVPVLGFCAGAQMMAQTYGSPIGAIDDSESGDMLDDHWKKRAHEFGFTPVYKTTNHPLLAGIDDEMVLMQMHYWEIKEIPAGFINLAHTAITPVQLIAHECLPLFGTQFHPEKWDATHPHGRLFLENFFKIVKESTAVQA